MASGSRPIHGPRARGRIAPGGARGLLLAAALVLAGPAALAQEPAPEAQAERGEEARERAREAAEARRERAEPQRERIFGRELMSEEELVEHRRKMRSLTGEEREAYRRDHHERMRERAAERGVELPEEPRDRGRGGMGRGPGEARGRGPTEPRGRGPTEPRGRGPEEPREGRGRGR